MKDVASSTGTLLSSLWSEADLPAKLWRAGASHYGFLTFKGEFEESSYPEGERQ
ncbi:MAG: hypothetical protein HXY36_04750 [Chloroflexi bacterium]|nr:hypothetical protein [Chloroflexota bacterium]